MRLLFLGDVVGRAGRDAVTGVLPGLIAEFGLDLVVVNAENAAGGYGLTLEIAKSLFAAGADVLTLGNHSWDQKSLLTQIDQEPRILRPLNLTPGAPGRGAHVYAGKKGGKILVASLHGRLEMDLVDCPFQAIDKELSRYRLGASVDAILVDMHAEATSEKMAMGHFLDGRVSCVVGSHTHIPTADAHILVNGTGFQSDAGMCGDYDSVIGMKKEQSLYRWTRRLPLTERMGPAEGPATVCGVVVETDAKTGLTLSMTPVRRGGRLSQA